MIRRALYAGSFDPPTNGHIEVIRAGAELFDELIVAVGVNPEKTPMFSVDERIKMLQSYVEFYPNVRVTSFENKFQIRYAQEIGANFILRGIRNVNDFEYERTIRNINSDFHGEVVRMIYIIPKREFADISSSMVKSLIGPVGWVNLVGKYVPHEILDCLIKKVNGENNEATF